MRAPSPVVRRSPPALGLAALLFLSGCDEKLQRFIENASARQQAREQKKLDDADLAARGLAPPDKIVPEIAAVLQIVRISDYDFIVRKGKRKTRGKDVHTRYNGLDFASLLETKSRWLGRGITSVDEWLEDIGSSAFFSGATYLVRLPDGREMTFRTWLDEELAALPPEPDGSPALLPAPGATPTATPTSAAPAGP